MLNLWGKAIQNNYNKLRFSVEAIEFLLWGNRFIASHEFFDNNFARNIFLSCHSRVFLDGSVLSHFLQSLTIFPD